MREPLLQYLKCVYDSSSLQLDLVSTRQDSEGNRYSVEGTLRCPECRREFPILDEVAFIAEDELIESMPVVREWKLARQKPVHSSQHAPVEEEGGRTLEQVQSFWNSRPSGGIWEEEDEQMEGLERWRVQTHPWLEGLSGYADHASETMLEVGGGQGLCTHRFAAGGAHVVALDLSYESLKISQRRMRRKALADRVDFIVGNAENLPFLPSHFDHVYSHGVIHHSKNTQQCIREISRVVKSGSPVFVMYYHTWSLTKLVEGTAKLTHKVLTAVTGDDQAFLKVVRFFLRGYKDRAFVNFLQTGKSATLHAPFIQTFSRRQTRQMFREAGFVDIRLTVVHLSEEVAVILRKLHIYGLHAWLEKRFGWDLIIRARKG